MEWLQIVVLALVQGLTEFLPISSSAHLILVPRFLGWPDQGLAFDVATHFGSLIAVVLYYRRDLRQLTGDWLASLQARQPVGESATVWALLWGTLPLVVVGFLLKDLVETSLRSPLVIAATTVGFGLLLGWAAWHSKRRAEQRHIGIRDGVIIGLFQAIAVIPGTSRSGITMTGALLRGWSAADAARFSFLLSIPAISIASAYKGLQLIIGAESVDLGMLVMATVLSGVSAFTCIYLFLKIITRMGMMPFVVYRLGLGALLLWVFG